MNNTFKNFLNTFHINKHNNTESNESNPLSPHEHSHEQQTYRQSEFEKTFYQSGISKNANQTNQTFSSHLNTSNTLNTQHNEPNLDDVKNLLSCYCVKQDHGTGGKEKSAMSVYNFHDADNIDKETLNRYNIRSEILNTDIDQIEKNGFKSFQNTSRNEKKTTQDKFLNHNSSSHGHKNSSMNMYTEINKAKGYSERNEFYENPYKSIQDIKLNKQIFELISDIQNQVQYNAYIEKHKIVEEERKKIKNMPEVKESKPKFLLPMKGSSLEPLREVDEGTKALSNIRYNFF